GALAAVFPVATILANAHPKVAGCAIRHDGDEAVVGAAQHVFHVQPVLAAGAAFAALAFLAVAAAHAVLTLPTACPPNAAAATSLAVAAGHAILTVAPVFPLNAVAAIFPVLDRVGFDVVGDRLSSDERHQSLQFGGGDKLHDDISDIDQFGIGASGTEIAFLALAA